MENDDNISIEDSIINKIKSTNKKKSGKRGKPDIILNTDKIPDIRLEIKHNKFKKYIVAVPVLLLLFLVMFITTVMMTCKVVFAPVIGSTFRIGDVSFVPNTYQLSVKDISLDSEVIYKTKDVKGREKTPGFGPIIYRFEKGTVTKIGDWYVHLYGEDPRKLIRILGTDVMYIIEDDL